MDSDNTTRKVKKVKGLSTKKDHEPDHEETGKKQKKPTFEGDDFIAPKQKKGENAEPRRHVQFNVPKEEEHDENLNYDDEYDDEWEEEDVVNKEELEENKMNEDNEEDYEDYDEEELTKKFGEIKFSDQPVIYEPPVRNRKSKKKGDEVKPFLGTAKNLAEGEVLDFDNRAYDMFHRANSEWPCLSLDVIMPEHNRKEIVQPTKIEVKEYPLTVYVVAGTQAPQANDNAIYIMKWSQLHKTRYDDESEVLDDEDIDNSDEPAFHTLPIKHPAAINRIRSMNGSSVVALWDETGAVAIYDGTKHTELLAEHNEELNELLEDGENKNKLTLKPPKDPNQKNFLLSAFPHSSEGFALGWSPHTLGVLATGSQDRKIFLYKLADENGSSWIMDESPFIIHKGSVEDLQFAPNNPNVLATCSVDGTIKFIDFRSDQKKKAEGTIQVSNTDVNVISWSSHAPNLIASGSDDGTIQVWDIRYANKVRSVAEIQFHQDPITSIEFQPYEDSVITAASADNRITIWDFSVEADVKSKDEDVPDQLMFMHQGVEDVKEIRHHPYISELVLSTAANGFNIFKPNYDEEEEDDM